MYAGYNLLLDPKDPIYSTSNSNAGQKVVDQHNDTIEKTIDSFKALGPSGRLDGSKLKATWFPQINADVFISHSHKDENLAIALAGYLKSNFDLVVFVDSCIWGHSNKLQEIIDKEYCATGQGTYHYDKRNASTAHVHMMLATALSQMIDSTECVFFLNTPHSILPNTTDMTQTESPWIYLELIMTSLIRRRPTLLKTFAEAREDGGIKDSWPQVQYDIDLGHLIKLDKPGLERWRHEAPSLYYRARDTLDTLYKQTKVPPLP